ncbi:hypothetical protein BJ546DRAFT_499729 [Cryomyces antarcticus]
MPHKAEGEAIRSITMLMERSAFNVPRPCRVLWQTGDKTVLHVGVFQSCASCLPASRLSDGGIDPVSPPRSTAAENNRREMLHEHLLLVYHTFRRHNVNMCLKDNYWFGPGGFHVRDDTTTLPIKRRPSCIDYGLMPRFHKLSYVVDVLSSHCFCHILSFPCGGLVPGLPRPVTCSRHHATWIARSPLPTLNWGRLPVEPML